MSSLIYAMAGELWHAMKEDYEAEVERRYGLADEACTGYLVNARGKAAGIAGRDLFTGSPDRAYRYASEELVDYWRRKGRITLPQFEAEWLSIRGGLEAYATQVYGN